MTAEQAESLIAAVEAVKVVGDYILFTMLIGVGLAIWRLLVLGKNSRNLWS